MEIILTDFLRARCQCFVQQCVKQAAAGVVAGGEACLQPVAEGHEFIHFCNDAVLFCQGGRHLGKRART